MCSQGHIMGVYIETDMRSDAFDQLEKLSDSYYANTKIGQIMGRITSDLFDVTEFAHHCPEEFFIAFIKIVVSFVILCYASVPLTILIFACVPFMIFGSIKLNHKLNMCIRLFDGLMYSVTIIAGGLFLVYGKINAGDLVMYMLYVSTLIATIRRLVEFAEQFSQGITGIERFFEIMDTPIDIKDAEDAKELEVSGGEIEFDNVSFEYPDDHNRVLHELSLKIKSGENLALVGESGGGKTTMASLIPRFYDVTSGAVKIDGQDIKKVTMKSLRENIGIVQQDVYLFSGTVAENIAYGKPGATREEIIHAAKLAGADSFITELKDGYDSYVGERGVKLSGGQKQRISIARVFLKNPKILLLDEATSALDNESEILIENSLKKLSVGRTTLTIAHRLTTIQHADRIIVLGKTGIVEEGNHEQLLEKKGVYYRLWNGIALEEVR